MHLCAKLVADLRLTRCVGEDGRVEKWGERPFNLFEGAVGLRPQQCLQDLARIRRNVQFQISNWTDSSQTLEHFPGETDSLRRPLSLWGCFNRLGKKARNVTRNPIRGLGICQVGQVWLQDGGDKRFER